MPGRIRKEAETEDEEMVEMGCRIVYSCSRLTVELRLSSTIKVVSPILMLHAFSGTSYSRPKSMALRNYYHGFENIPAPKARPIRVCMNGVCRMKAMKAVVSLSFPNYRRGTIAVA